MKPEVIEIIDGIDVTLNAGGMHTINVVLAFVMFGVALGIKPRTFVEVFKKPKSVILGVVCQQILLPLFTFILAVILGDSISWTMAMGMILVASCPGGNISNFISSLSKANVELSELTSADKWILSKVNKLAKDVTDNLDKFELGIALQKVYDFIWEEFCDWYIEMVKPRLYGENDTTKAAALWTLKTVLVNSLKLLHPYMPFVTEEIFCTLQDDEESIMISEWPAFKEEWNFAADEMSVETIKEAVRGIRAVRTELNVAPSKKAQVFVVSEKEDVRNIFENGKVFFATLGYASEVTIQSDKTGIDEDAVSTVIPAATIYMPFAELVDIEKEIERLEKEKTRLEGELKRVNGMLSNEKFVSKAPEAKIAEEKAKLDKYTKMMEQVVERLAQLKK